MASAPTANLNGGSLGWRKWQVYTTMLMMLITMGTIIFRAGVAGATEEARVDRLEAETRQMKEEFARKDVIEQRLAAMEATQKRIEAQEERQSISLENLLMELQRKR